jgi:hypothetical protein
MMKSFTAISTKWDVYRDVFTTAESTAAQRSAALDLNIELLTDHAKIHDPVELFRGRTLPR